MLRSLCCFFLCLLVSALALNATSEKTVSRDGYVTGLISAGEFRLNQERVVVTHSTSIVNTETTPQIETKFSGDWGEDRIFLGEHVHVTGVEDAQTHILTAKRVKLIDGGVQVKVSGVGLEDRAPVLVREGSGWRGTAYADGYEIVVDPKVKVQLPQNVLDPNSFRPNLWIHYQAIRKNNAGLQATQLSFIENNEIAEEQAYREKRATGLGQTGCEGTRVAR